MERVCVDGAVDFAEATGRAVFAAADPGEKTEGVDVAFWVEGRLE